MQFVIIAFMMIMREAINVGDSTLALRYLET